MVERRQTDWQPQNLRNNMVRSSLRFLFKSYIPVLEASSLEISKGTNKLKASMRSFHVPSSKGQEMGSLAREKTSK